MNVTEKKADIIIADNQYLVIEGLKSILGGLYNILDVAGNKDDLKSAILTRIPQIVIIDYFLFDFNGYEDLKEIRRLSPGMKIIILTSNINRPDLTEFNNMGIRNILHKNADGEEIISCIEAALKGKKSYSEIVLDMMFEMNGKKEIVRVNNRLTSSETEIVRLIAQGLTTKQIAGRKFLSYHTVMTHRKNILRKLGVSNASELIMFAVKKGIIDTIEYHI